MDSLPPVLKRHWPLLAAALLLGVYGWALFLATASGHDGAIGPAFNAPGADWVIFMAAGRAAFTPDIAHIYDQLWITNATNSQFAHWLSAPLPFPLFPYPPVYLLLVAPFAHLPVFWSLLLSQLLSFAALAWALRRYAPDKSWLFFLLGAFLAPAASNNVLAGTNAVLVAALVVGGYALMDRRPWAAGALWGVMIFKPQYFPLLVLAVVAARQWRMFGGGLAAGLSMVAASILLFGLQPWLDWMNVYLQPQRAAAVNATEWGHMWDNSISTCLNLLGAPHGAGLAAQGAAMLAAAVAVWRTFAGGHPARLPILLCALLLASPHVSNYDMILLAIAALIHVRTLPGEARPLALILPLAAWLAPLYNPPRVNPLGFATPLVLLAMLAVLLLTRPPARRD